jgi:hypothetical protein
MQAACPPCHGLCVPRVEIRCPHPCPEATGVNNASVFALLLMPLVRDRQIHEDLGVPLTTEH